MTRDEETRLIREELAAQVAALVRAYYPGAVFRGRHAYPMARSAADTGSMEVELQGSKQGQWIRRSTGEGGDALALLAYAVTGQASAGARAFDEARRFLGLKEGETYQPRPRPAPAQAEPSPDLLAAARSAYGRAGPGRGTLAEV